MRILVTGATGYIGGSIATALLARGDAVIGLTRDKGGAASLARRGIEPLVGALGDPDALRAGAGRADAVIDAAEANQRGSVDAFLAVLAGTGKAYIRTSGSGIVADEAAGEPSDHIFDETTPFEPSPRMALRAALDEEVRAASAKGIRTVVIRPSLIYGPGRGVDRESFQLPLLLDHALRTRQPRWVGRGLNVWSHVHLDDAVSLYLAALDRAPAGSLYYVEAGEMAMRDLVLAIAELHGLTAAACGWSLEEAVAAWGPRIHVSLASNSRVRAVAAREQLGWRPRAPSLLDELTSGYYATDYLDRHHPGVRAQPAGSTSTARSAAAAAGPQAPQGGTP